MSMTQVVEFPQRQHQEFRRLVFKAVFDAARVQQMDIENYISAIYQDGENPPLFASTHSLNRVYLRFKDLIETTVSSDPEGDRLSGHNSAYLCFRVYLHNICMTRQTLPESESEQYLQDALKEYFQAGAKVLSIQEEVKILRYLKRLRQQASSQPPGTVL